MKVFLILWGLVFAFMLFQFLVNEWFGWQKQKRINEEINEKINEEIKQLPVKRYVRWSF